jgi:hypothetical protein
MRRGWGTLAIALVAAGCFSPKVQPGGACAEGGACPDGLACDDKTNTCELAPGTFPDAGGQPDGGTPDACVAADEVCDGLDQNCDGTADDGFPVGDACSVGTGACAVDGVYECDLDVGDVQCVATAGSPAQEVCGNGVDEDCDGGDVACPPNDLASGAIDVSAGGLFEVDLPAAHDDNSGGCGMTGGRDVFYKITVPDDEVVYLDTFGSDYPTALRVFANGCGTLGMRLACETGACGGGQSQTAIELSAGTHCIVVDQAAGASETDGHTHLNVIRTGRQGQRLTAATGSVDGSTLGLGSDWENACGDGSAAGDVGYFFTTCEGTTNVDADTCTQTEDIDTIVSLYEGDGDGLACDDDSCGLAGHGSHISVDVTGPAGIYWLVVDNYQTGNEGPYTLAWTFD